MSIVQLDLLGQLAPLQFQSIAQAALALEAYQTPRWAAEAGLSAVPLQKRVLDPCVGRGILAQTALARGHEVRSADIYEWEYDGPRTLTDFLNPEANGLVDGWECLTSSTMGQIELVA